MKDSSHAHVCILAAIEKAAPPGLAEPMTEFNRYLRHALNSFVRAGLHPPARVRAGFPLQQAETVLRFSTGMPHFGYRLLATLTGSQELMNRVTRTSVVSSQGTHVDLRSPW